MTSQSNSLSFGTLLRHEWRRLARESGFWLLMGLLAVLLVIAGLHGKAEALRVEAAATTTQERQDKAFKDRKALAAEIENDADPPSSPWDARSAWGTGRYRGIDVVAPTPPLLALAVGQSDLSPVSHRIDTGPAALARPDSRLSNPLRLSAGHFDIAFVVLYLLPLLIIALLFDLVASDRESGVLRMLLGGPMSLSRLVMARALVRGGSVVLAAVAIILLIGVLASGFSARLLLFAAVTILYGSFWVVLSAFVNALGKSSAANAVVLAGAWILLVVVLPAGIHTFVQTVFPSPSRATYIAVQRSANAEGLRESREAMSRFLDHHPDLADEVGEGEPTYVMAATARDEAVETELQPLVEADATRRTRRESFLSVTNLTSPAMLAHEALLEAAGTGRGQRAFVAGQLAEFREEWSAHFLPRYFDDNIFSAADYDNIPRLSFEAEEIGSILNQIALPIGGVLVWVLVIAAGAHRLLARPISAMNL